MGDDLRRRAGERLGELGEVLGADADRRACSDPPRIRSIEAAVDHDAAEPGAFVEVLALDRLDIGARQAQREAVSDGHPGLWRILIVARRRDALADRRGAYREARREIGGAARREIPRQVRAACK